MQSETMPIGSAPGGLEQAELYLQTVGELSRELKQAMEAVVARSLPAFQDSVCRQREACSNLLALPRYLNDQGELQSLSSGSGGDAELAARINAAGAELQILNKRYSALLGHTGDTMRLVARLLGGYRSPSLAGRATDLSPLSTWSCEV